MFAPLYLLPQYNVKERTKYRDRWNSAEGQRVRGKILEMIRDGGGEDFLQWEFEQGDLGGFLEDMWDLSGIDIFDEEIHFPTADNFEAINFNYASFFNCKFENATFASSTFQFTKFYGCEFINSLFAHTSFYGATLEKTKFTNCDLERSRITNCELMEVVFKNCFIPERIFFECKFDEQTTLDDPIKSPNTKKAGTLEQKNLSEIFKGIKEGYSAGDVINQSRKYFFKENQSITRFNIMKGDEKVLRYFLEFIAGYGINPLRVLLTMLTIFFIFSGIFISRIGLSKGLLLSAGAFFTFGANTYYLQDLNNLYMVCYIAESFLGISLMALFVIVLFKFFFIEK
jgi:hypothetical protein